MDLLKNQEVVDLLKLLGGYLVGGCVRDSLLKKQPKDIDIACPLEPLEIFTVLKDANYNFRMHGKAFGVYVVSLNSGDTVEVAPMRIDYNYNGRYSEVEFVKDLEQDCARRDLTVNAMAVSVDGTLYDFFGGKEDLQSRTIRFVRSAEERIKEDNLRAWRAIRFAYQLNFSLDEDAKNGIQSYINYFFASPVFENMRVKRSALSVTKGKAEEVHGLYKLSEERIIVEVEKCLMNISFNRDNFLLLGGLLETVGLPVLNTLGLPQPKSHHSYDVFTHTLHVINLVPPIFKLRMAALCHDLGKSGAITFKSDGTPTFPEHEDISEDISRRWLTKMKFPNELIEETSFIVKHHMDSIAQTQKGKMKFLSKFPNDEMFSMFFLHRVADILGKGADRDDSIRLLDHINQCLDVLRVRKTYNTVSSTKIKLEVNGRDVMEKFNLPPCQTVGKVLKLVEDFAYEDPSNNQRDKLLSFLDNLDLSGL